MQLELLAAAFACKGSSMLQEDASPLLEEPVFLGSKLQLNLPLLIVLQDILIRYPLSGALVSRVIRKSVLQRPPTSQIELVALHIPTGS